VPEQAGGQRAGAERQDPGPDRQAPPGEGRRRGRDVAQRGERGDAGRPAGGRDGRRDGDGDAQSHRDRGGAGAQLEVAGGQVDAGAAEQGAEPSGREDAQRQAGQ
jgi:translation initiation factor IF-2